LFLPAMSNAVPWSGLVRATGFIVISLAEGQEGPD